jgi:hypothetical protein
MSYCSRKSLLPNVDDLISEETFQGLSTQLLSKRLSAPFYPSLSGSWPPIWAVIVLHGL